MNDNIKIEQYQFQCVCVFNTKKKFSAQPKQLTMIQQPSSQTEANYIQYREHASTGSFNIAALLWGSTCCASLRVCQLTLHTTFPHAAFHIPPHQGGRGGGTGQDEGKSRQTHSICFSSLALSSRNV